MQEDQKPIQVAAGKEFRGLVERLLPLTTPDPAIKEWTVDGVLSHAAPQAAADEEVLVLVKSRMCVFHYLMLVAP